jgi:hypothetical protein
MRMRWPVEYGSVTAKGINANGIAQLAHVDSLLGTPSAGAHQPNAAIITDTRTITIPHQIITRRAAATISSASR